MRTDRFVSWTLSASLLLVGLLALTGCGGSPKASPPEIPAAQTAPPPPRSYQPPAGAPTYSQVIATYPKGVELCTTEGPIGSRDGEFYMGMGSNVQIRNGESLIRWYGTKLTAETEIKLEGKTYQPEAKLTVDKDLNWVEVSSWE